MNAAKVQLGVQRAELIVGRRQPRLIRVWDGRRTALWRRGAVRQLGEAEEGRGGDGVIEIGEVELFEDGGPALAGTPVSVHIRGIQADDKVGHPFTARCFFVLAPVLSRLQVGNRDVNARRDKGRTVDDGRARGLGVGYSCPFAAKVAGHGCWPVVHLDPFGSHHLADAVAAGTRGVCGARWGMRNGIRAVVTREG